MKLLVVLSLIVAAGSASPVARFVNPSQNAKLLRYENDINHGLGGYYYAFAQDDGTRAEQTGRLVNEGREDQSLAVSGSFSWVGPDGETYLVNYTAGEQGYKPEIEQGPGGGVPPAVVASLLG